MQQKSRISGIGLKNFRVFKEYTKIPIAPITILIGKNNSGKSSVIKALQLISDNRKDNELKKIDLNLPGEKHGLNEYELAKNNKTNSDKIHFALYFSGTDHYYKSVDKQEFPGGAIAFFPKDLDKKVERNFKLSFDYLKEKQYERDFSDKKWIKIQKNIITNLIICEKDESGFSDDIFSLVFRRYEPDDKGLINFLWLNFQKYIEPPTTSANLSFFDYEEHYYFEKLDDYFLLIDNVFFEEKLQSFEKSGIEYFIKMLNFYLLWYSSFGLVKTENLEKILRMRDIKTVKDIFEKNESAEKYFNYLNIVGEVKIFEKDKEDTIIGSKVLKANYLENIKLFYKVGKEVKRFFMEQIDFDYLEAVKANAQRIYLRQWQGSTLNELLEDFRKKVESDKLSHKKTDEKTKTETSYSPAEEFISKWFGKEGFEIGDKFRVINHAYGSEIKLTKNGKELDFADLGYGSIQLLSILLKITLSNSKILMLEEPEIHLHPDFQSKLSDMFWDAHRKFGLSFVIETHSEYMVRKLQYLTAKDKIKPDDVVINYFTDPEDLEEGEEQVRSIRIKENGSLTGDFGTGFFDEADNLAVKLFLMKDDSKN
jgi:predicted ATPase